MNSPSAPFRGPQLSEGQKLLVDEVRRFCEERIRPGIAQRDRDHEFPGDILSGLGEMGLLGMELYLTRPNEPKIDEETFHTTAEGKALLTGSSEAWGRAAVAAGTDPEAATDAANRTTAFYTGDPVASD